MKKLNEQATLTNVHLSDTQKLVMTKIKAAANSNVALEQISRGANIVAAKEALTKLGLIQITDGAEITEKGQQTMLDENLVDDSGELTEEGQKFAYAKDLEDLSTKNKDDAKPPATPGEQDPTADANLPTDLAGGQLEKDGMSDVGESFTLFKDIDAMAKIKLL